jgi:hypothetical protein
MMSRMMCKYDYNSVCIDEFTDKNTIADDCDSCPYNPKNEKRCIK